MREWVSFSIITMYGFIPSFPTGRASQFWPHVQNFSWKMYQLRLRSCDGSWLKGWKWTDMADFSPRFTTLQFGGFCLSPQLKNTFTTQNLIYIPKNCLKDFSSNFLGMKSSDWMNFTFWGFSSKNGTICAIGSINSHYFHIFSGMGNSTQ